MKRIKFNISDLAFYKETLYFYHCAHDAPLKSIKPLIDINIKVKREFKKSLVLPVAEIKRRTKLGHFAYIAYHKDKPVAYLFCAQNECWVDEIKTHLYIKDKEAYLYDAVTDPGYRRKKIYQVLIRYAVEHLRQNGIRNVLIFSSAKNIPSVRAIKNIGFKRYGTAVFYCLPGLCYWNYKRFDNKIASKFEYEINKDK